jgi:hypothetical protein
VFSLCGRNQLGERDPLHLDDAKIIVEPPEHGHANAKQAVEASSNKLAELQREWDEARERRTK